MNSIKITGLFISLLLLTGCYAHHPHDFHSPAAAGAVLGAVVGGVAGYAIGNSHSHHQGGYHGGRHSDSHGHHRRGRHH
ncbi:MAG: hypothetical protein K0U68_14865 [Gammaproteobacteria bacterium]|nr:hypothetical protein [Gammaproteobacteria bacterium]